MTPNQKALEDLRLIAEYKLDITWDKCPVECVVEYHHPTLGRLWHTTRAKKVDFQAEIDALHLALQNMRELLERK